MYSALDIIKQELKSAREVFEGTVVDIKQSQLHIQPGGKALPLGSTYAHLLLSEDLIVHQMLQGEKPLSQTKWKDKTGVSEQMPEMNADWAKNNEEWSRSVKINLKQLREYAKAVYASTDTYV